MFKSKLQGAPLRTFRIPPTAVGDGSGPASNSKKLRTVWVLPKNSSKVRVSVIGVAEKPDLNDPPTTVGGIRILLKLGFQ